MAYRRKPIKLEEVIGFVLNSNNIDCDTSADGLSSDKEDNLGFQLTNNDSFEDLSQKIWKGCKFELRVIWMRILSIFHQLWCHFDSHFGLGYGYIFISWTVYILDNYYQLFWYLICCYFSLKSVFFLGFEERTSKNRKNDTCKKLDILLKPTIDTREL